MVFKGEPGTSVTDSSGKTTYGGTPGHSFTGSISSGSGARRVQVYSPTGEKISDTARVEVGGEWIEPKSALKISRPGSSQYEEAKIKYEESTRPLTVAEARNIVEVQRRVIAETTGKAYEPLEAIQKLQVGVSEVFAPLKAEKVMEPREAEPLISLIKPGIDIIKPYTEAKRRISIAPSLIKERKEPLVELARRVAQYNIEAKRYVEVPYFERDIRKEKNLEIEREKIAALLKRKVPALAPSKILSTSEKRGPYKGVVGKTTQEGVLEQMREQYYKVRTSEDYEKRMANPPIGINYVEAPTAALDLINDIREYNRRQEQGLSAPDEATKIIARTSEGAGDKYTVLLPSGFRKVLPKDKTTIRADGREVTIEFYSSPDLDKLKPKVDITPAVWADTIEQREEQRRLTGAFKVETRHLEKDITTSTKQLETEAEAVGKLVDDYNKRVGKLQGEKDIFEEKKTKFEQSKNEYLVLKANYDADPTTVDYENVNRAYLQHKTLYDEHMKLYGNFEETRKKLEMEGITVAEKAARLGQTKRDVDRKVGDYNNAVTIYTRSVEDVQAKDKLALIGKYYKEKAEKADTALEKIGALAGRFAVGMAEVPRAIAEFAVVSPERELREDIEKRRYGELVKRAVIPGYGIFKGMGEKDPGEISGINWRSIEGAIDTALIGFAAARGIAKTGVKPLLKKAAKKPLVKRILPAAIATAIGAAVVGPEVYQVYTGRETPAGAISDIARVAGKLTTLGASAKITSGLGALYKARALEAAKNRALAQVKLQAEFGGNVFVRVKGKRVPMTRIAGSAVEGKLMQRGKPIKVKFDKYEMEVKGTWTPTQDIVGKPIKGTEMTLTTGTEGAKFRIFEIGRKGQRIQLTGWVNTPIVETRMVGIAAGEKATTAQQQQTGYALWRAGKGKKVEYFVRKLQENTALEGIPTKELTGKQTSAILNYLKTTPQGRGVIGNKRDLQTAVSYLRRTDVGPVYKVSKKTWSHLQRSRDIALAYKNADKKKVLEAIGENVGKPGEVIFEKGQAAFMIRRPVRVVDVRTGKVVETSLDQFSLTPMTKRGLMQGNYYMQELDSRTALTEFGRTELAARPEIFVGKAIAVKEPVTMVVGAPQRVVPTPTGVFGFAPRATGREVTTQVARRVMKAARFPGKKAQVALLGRPPRDAFRPEIFRPVRPGVSTRIGEVVRPTPEPTLQQIPIAKTAPTGLAIEVTRLPITAARVSTLTGIGVITEVKPKLGVATKPISMTKLRTALVTRPAVLEAAIPAVATLQVPSQEVVELPATRLAQPTGLVDITTTIPVAETIPVTAITPAPAAPLPIGIPPITGIGWPGAMGLWPRGKEVFRGPPAVREWTVVNPLADFPGQFFANLKQRYGGKPQPTGKQKAQAATYRMLGKIEKMTPGKVKSIVGRSAKRRGI